MAKKDAELTVGADASAAERAAGAVKAAWKGAAGELTDAFASAARSVTTDLAGVALAQGKVNFSAQHQQVRDFEAATARLAVAMGRDLEGVRSSIEATGQAIGKRPQEVTAWAAEVGKLTYNFGGATEAIRGMSELAAQTGRSVDDYRGLAVELGTVGRVAGDTRDVIGSLGAQAKELGVNGGIAAFADQIQGLEGSLSRFAINGQKDLLAVTAAAGALGKGYSPGQAARVQQEAIGAVANDPIRWSRYLGRDILDKYGHVEKPEQVLQDITERTKRLYGNDALRILRLNFGAETGSAMFNADFKAAAGAAGLAPSTTAADAQARYLETDAGKREKASADLAISSRHLMGSSTALGRAADKLQEFAAHSPITSTMLSTAVTGAIAGYLPKLGGVVGEYTGTSGVAGGLAKLGPKGVGALGTAGALAGAFGAGYGIGTVLDNTFGISDWIAGVETADDRRKQAAALAGRVSDIRNGNKALNAAIRGSGLSGAEKGEAINAAAAIAVRGGSLNESSLAAALIQQNKGMSDEDASRIAHAVAAAMRDVRITIVNSTGGPIEKTDQGRQSPQAGGPP